MDLKREKHLLIKLTNNKTKLNNLNKLIKSKLNCVIVDEKQHADSQLILIQTIDAEFTRGLTIKVAQLFENTFGFDNFELISSVNKQNCNISMLYFQSSLTEEVFQFYASHFKQEYKRAVDSGQYALVVPDFQFKTQNIVYTRYLIKFEKISSLVYETKSVRISDDYLWIRFLFRIGSSSSFLFSLKSATISLHFQIKDSKLEMVMLNQTAIQFEETIEASEWYEFEVQADQTRLTVKFKKNSLNECTFAQKSFTLNEFKLEEISIGSELASNRSALEFYSDGLEMADFKLNNFDLFSEKLVKKYAKKVLLTQSNPTPFAKCQSDIHSSNCDIGKLFKISNINFLFSKRDIFTNTELYYFILALGSFKMFTNGRAAKLRFKMKENYKLFTMTANKPETFEIFVQFKPHLNDTKEIVLFRTRRSILLVS